MTNPQRGAVFNGEEMAGDRVPGNWNPTYEFGVTGVRRTGGYVDDEFLPQLRGRKGVQIYREMSDNDSTVGALLFAFVRLLSEVKWSVEPASSKAEDRRNAELVEQAKDDMSHSWVDFVVELCSFLPYGWSLHEMCFKRRLGPWYTNAGNGNLHRSKYDDGRISWAKFPIRAQETLQRWVFHPKTNDVIGMVQMAAPDYSVRIMPIAKSLLFRTGLHKGNPEGRALDPDQLIPTPDGWTRMGELRVGSRVFDERGVIRHVVARANWTRRPRYRVGFSDGTEIIADGEHEWLASTAKNRDRFQLVSTAEMACTLGRIWAIDHAAPVNYVSQNLLIDPYVLGTWLGDGDSNSARISCHADDLVEQMAAVEARGYEVIKMGENGPAGGLGRYFRIGSGLQADLRRLGLVGNKHIPAQYLLTDESQRRALLAGLLDTDGHCDKQGRVEFVSVTRNLVDGVAELARSLGIHASISRRRTALASDERGRSRRETWVVRFMPTAAVFGLERKNERIHPTKRRGRHYVRSVDRIADGPTVCIEVDSPSHLFLAGEGFIPTHNSILRNAYQAYYYRKRLQEYEAIGVERDLAGMPVAHVPASILNAKPGTAEMLMLTEFKKMVRQVRRDENEGLIFPRAYDSEGNLLYEFELLSAGGSRQFDTNSIIARYKLEILQQVLADFIEVGHEGVGSYSMHTDKRGLFQTAGNSFITSVADNLNRKAVPLLFSLNGEQPAELPRLVPGDVDSPDLAQLAAFMTSMAGIGMPWFPDPKMEKFVREVARVPAMDKNVEMAREQEQRQATILGLAQQRLEAIQMQQQAAQGAAQTEQAAQGAEQGAIQTASAAKELDRPGSTQPPQKAAPAKAAPRKAAGSRQSGRTPR